MPSLLMLFKSYRELYEQLHQTQLEQARKQAEWDIVAEKYLQSTQDNIKLTDTLAKMQEYVNQVATKSPIDLFEQYQKQVLQDEPYADGKIPDNAWLTPGESEN